MANFVQVTVSRDENGVPECKPEIVELHYNRPEGPDSVRWVLETGESSEALEIAFDEGSPFKKVEPVSSGRVVEGTENTKVEGDYSYTATIKRNGSKVGAVDPRVRNRP